MYFRPISRLGTDAEYAFHQMNPFFHADKPQPRREDSGWTLSESLSVVPDTHPQAPWSLQEPDQHLRCLGMFVDVLEAFLCHTVQTGGCVDREGSGYVSMHIPNSRSRAPSEFVDLISNGRLQAEMFKKRGVQLIRKVVDVVSKLGSGLPKTEKVIAKQWVLRERPFERTDIDGEDRKALRKIIVHFACKPLPLPFLSCQQLCGQLFESCFVLA